jgi:hypothetical protein
MIALVLVVLAFRQIGDALNDIISGGQTGAVFRRKKGRRTSWIPLSTTYEQPA